jgi:RimJ/RimL family protein N-acetyltransferase
MLAKSLTARIRREGFWHAIRDVAGTLRPARFEVWKLSHEYISQHTPAEESQEILVGEAALEALKLFRPSVTNMPVEFNRDEIDGIESCFLALIDNRPAAIAWSYDHTRPAHFLRMRPGDVEIRSVYSLEEFRGRGLAKAVISCAYNSLLRDGIRNIYAVIHFRNEASLRAFRSTHFTKLAELHRPPIFGPRFVTATERAESWLEAIARLFRSS